MPSSKHAIVRTNDYPVCIYVWCTKPNGWKGGPMNLFLPCFGVMPGLQLASFVISSDQINTDSIMLPQHKFWWQKCRECLLSRPQAVLSTLTILSTWYAGNRGQSCMWRVRINWAVIANQSCHSKDQYVTSECTWCETISWTRYASLGKNGQHARHAQIINTYS